MNQSTVSPISIYKKNMSIKDIENFALQLRRDIIEITWFSGTKSSHIGGELSATEIIAVLYGKILKLDPADAEWEERDRIILSKGHASALLYAAMAWRGYFEREKLFNEFNQINGLLQEHANMKLKGIEAPTGSLGMGLSVGCGMAWSAKLRYGTNKIPFNIYVVLSDGECTEGQTWEAAMSAAHYRLDNLIGIIDYNKYIISGTVKEVMNIEPLAQKWQSFGWHTDIVENGNDVSQLCKALEKSGKKDIAPGKPRIIIANTVKCRGISFMEADPVTWHAGHLDKTLYEQCKKELGL